MSLFARIFARSLFGMTESIPIAEILSSYLWDTLLADGVRPHSTQALRKLLLAVNSMAKYVRAIPDQST